MNTEELENRLSELPLYIYFFIDPRELEFTERVRWICEHDCSRYGTSWACPPAVGTVEECRKRCLSYAHGLVISSIAEVSDISNIDETLAARVPHEELTDRVRSIMQELGAEPFVLSTESCAVCRTCAYKQNLPCRHPDRMHPCVESQGINIIPILEANGLEFQFGQNIVTWVSLLLYN